MVALYLALFVSPLRSGAISRDRYPWGDHLSRAGCGSALFLAQLVGMLVLTMSSGGWEVYLTAVEGVVQGLSGYLRMSIHWASAVTSWVYVIVPLVILAAGGYALLDIRRQSQYVRPGKPQDVVADAGQTEVAVHSLPFVLLLLLSTSVVRTHSGHHALSQILVSPFSANLCLILATLLYPLLHLLVAYRPLARPLRFGIVGVDTFIFGAWGILILGAHVSNMLAYFVVLELFNVCALALLVIEGSTLDAAEKSGLSVVSEGVIVFFWISVFSAFAAFWGLGLLVAAGVSLSGVVPPLATEGGARAAQMLLVGGLCLKGAVPPLGWWVAEFYGGLTADQLSTYIAVLYLPLLAMVLSLGLIVGGTLGGADQLQRQVIVVSALSLVLGVTEAKTIRGALALSTLTSVALIAVALA